MTDSSPPRRDREDVPASSGDTPARPRRPYVKPAFVREAVFETTALACGKINPTIRQCNLVRKNS
jgi:hypothetical protein